MTIRSLVLFCLVLIPPCVFHGHRIRRRRAANADAGTAREPPEFGTMPARFKAENLDLEAEVSAVAGALAGIAHAHFVRIRLAISPDSAVRMDAFALRAALRGMIHAAVVAAPGGQVLVTAMALGTQMHVRIVDDGARTDQRLREGVAREAGSMIALQGGSIAVEAREGQGTMVTVMLPVPGSASGAALSPANAAVKARQEA